MAFVDQIALSNDQNFRNRCEIAMIVAAQAVASEATSTVNHVNREALAKAIEDNPDAYVLAFTLGVVANPAITTASLDSDISFTVNSIFNGMAGVP